MDLCKKRLDSLQVDTPMTEELIQSIAPDCCEAMRKSLLSLDNPWQSLHKMHALIGSISSQLADRCLIVSTPIKRNVDSSTKLLSLAVPLLLHLDDSNKHETTEIIIDHSEVTVDAAVVPDNGGINNELSLRSNHNAADDEAVDISNRLYLEETIELMFDRWDQINKSFFDKKNKKFDLTKVPDVADMVSSTISFFFCIIISDMEYRRHD
jgi:hypothetical protein